MGISDLRELAVIHQIEYDELAGSIVGVDALNWLHRYLSIVVQYTDADVYTTDDGTEVPNLIGIVEGLPKFFEHGLYPVFVFDGAVIGLKEGELQERQERRRTAAERAEKARERDDEIEAARFRAQAQRVTAAMERTTLELLDLLDIPYLEAPTEAEAQAAHMAQSHSLDYVVSDDYDVLLYGAPLTIRQFTSKGNPECMDFEATLEKHAITWEQLVEIAILCGTDYNEGIYGVGPKTALAEIKEYGDLEAVLERRAVEIQHTERIRELFLHPAVTDEYDFDRSMTSDIEAAWTYVTETWEIPENRVEKHFERLKNSLG